MKQIYPQTWTYKGYRISPADRNSSGIRWITNIGTGEKLRADSKQSMRQLINESIAKKKTNT